jgi:NAD+ synthase
VKDVASKIINWIREQVVLSKCNGLVVGMSGGVDSSVVAVLGKLAMGENTLGVVMPCDDNEEYLDNIYIVCKKFNIKVEKFNLTPIYNEFKTLLPPASRVVMGNIKARLRMIVLYYFSNKLNYLVAGTSNKSEFVLGYFTKYGDGGVDILPIGGLLKTEVIELAKKLGIPDKIISATPTASLWEGQTDEEEIGFSYSQIDPIIKAIEEGREEVFLPHIKQKVLEMMQKSYHKRAPIPIFKM